MPDAVTLNVLSALTLLQRRGLVLGAHGRYRPAGTLAGEQTVVWKEAEEERRPRRIAATPQPRTRIGCCR